MKKLFYLLILIVIISCNNTQKNNIISIGIILPLTGDGAVYGQGIKKGIDFAYKSLSEEERKKVNLVYEYSKMNTKDAVGAFEKLTTFDNCDVIIGPFSSSEVLAIAPKANQKQVVILTPTATAPSITNAGDYIFRIIPSDEYDGAIMSEYAVKELKKSTLVLLYANNEYGVGMNESFTNHANKIGAKVLNTFSFENGTTDFKTILEKVKELKPNATFIVGGKELGYILKQSKELNIQTQFLSTGMIENNEIMDIAGNSAINTYYSYPSFRIGSQNQTIQNFVTRFKTKTNSNPDVLNALGFDCFMLINKAINNSQEDLKTYLDNMEEFEGVTGKMKFDSNGDVIKSIGIKMISDSGYVWVVDEFIIKK